MRRFQRIMRYKYSKALRRRDLWDREDGFRSFWGWRLPRQWLGGRWSDGKTLSSGKPLQADVQDPRGNRKQDKDPWDEWNKQWNQDYESFKAAVDKAIDRDPYGTLFGRHLRSPLSARNSGWTAWSWVFEPKLPPEEAEKSISESQKRSNRENQPPEVRKNDRFDAGPLFSVPTQAPKHTKRTTSTEAGDYEIDPITMKKIPKVSEAELPSSDLGTKTKPFLSSLFKEHGAVDIPVKTYKPHKIYGYGATQPSGTTDEGKRSDKSRSNPDGLQKGFENSRLREFQTLKASITGNSMDTTAEYGGKFNGKEKASSTSEPTGPKSSGQRSFETEDDAPLFSGTTYQSKASEIVASRGRKPDWLEKEGFQNDTKTLDLESKSNSRLETSLDRMVAKKHAEESLNTARLDGSFDQFAQRQREEDTDLLRAHDVRAAARTARKTKQQLEQAKREARQKLENDYISRQRDVETRSGKETESTFAKNIKTAWKHISQYPQGVVARTMQSLGLYNSNFKNYARPDKRNVDLNEKIVFKDEFLSKTPSIYTKKNQPASSSLDASPPSEEVLQTDRENQERTSALQRATQEAKIEEIKLQDQTTELATEIRNIYESEYGKIDVNHRQLPAENLNLSQNTDEMQTSEVTRKPHPLQTATVKPGIETNPVIDEHINEFEPRIADLKDRAKQIRRSTHEIGLSIRALRSNRPQTYWNAEPEPAEERPAADVVSSISATTTTTNNNQVADVVREEAEAPFSEISTEARVAAFLRGNGRPMFVFLAYSPDARTIEISPLTWRVFRKQDTLQRSVDMASVLTKLNHPSKYMPYLAALENEGYEPYKGGKDSLILKKMEKQALTPAEQAELSKPPAENESEIQATLGATLPATPKQAADVLDDIPPEIEPQPGPAAPTAPIPTTPKPRVMRRQEQVFSGQSLGKQPPEKASNGEGKQFASPDDDVRPTESTAGAGRAEQPQSDSFWTRVNRGLRRVVLTGLAMAGFAYTIGAVAESIGAQHSTRRIESEEEYRRRTGRPGIYSTENSR